MEIVTTGFAPRRLGLSDEATVAEEAGVTGARDFMLGGQGFLNTKYYLIGHFDCLVFGFCLFFESGKDNIFEKPKNYLG